ncbi:MAG TPA: NAD(P)H-dependent oxidoreductase [Devosia sp.]|nr:NAD(P)H-dependent oxidoreductase [Devosia sp.]
MYKVAVLVGSIRPNSTNLQFARALEKLALGRLRFDFIDLGALPFYDESLWNDPPPAVVDLKHRIAAADAVLFVTPEYNRSIPGVLKNAIDWPSRPSGHGVWEGKPAAIVGATAGQSGTAAAQAHLRAILPVLGVILMGRPEVYQTVRPGLIDDNYLITDERTRAFLLKWVDAFVAWIDRFGAQQPLAVAAE